MYDFDQPLLPNTDSQAVSDLDTELFSGLSAQGEGEGAAQNLWNSLSHSRAVGDLPVYTLYQWCAVLSQADSQNSKDQEILAIVIESFSAFFIRSGLIEQALSELTSDEFDCSDLVTTNTNGSLHTALALDTRSNTSAENGRGGSESGGATLKYYNQNAPLETNKYNAYQAMVSTLKEFLKTPNHFLLQTQAFTIVSTLSAEYLPGWALRVPQIALYLLRHQDLRNKLSAAFVSGQLLERYSSDLIVAQCAWEMQSMPLLGLQSGFPELYFVATQKKEALRNFLIPRRDNDVDDGLVYTRNELERTWRNTLVLIDPAYQQLPFKYEEDVDDETFYWILRNVFNPHDDFDEYARVFIFLAEHCLEKLQALLKTLGDPPQPGQDSNRLAAKITLNFHLFPIRTRLYASALLRQYLYDHPELCEWVYRDHPEKLAELTLCMNEGDRAAFLLKQQEVLSEDSLWGLLPLFAKVGVVNRKQFERQRFTTGAKNTWYEVVSSRFAMLSAGKVTYLNLRDQTEHSDLCVLSQSAVRTMLGCAGRDLLEPLFTPTRLEALPPVPSILACSLIADSAVWKAVKKHFRLPDSIRKFREKNPFFSARYDFDKRYKNKVKAYFANPKSDHLEDAMMCCLLASHPQWAKALMQLTDRLRDYHARPYRPYILDPEYQNLGMYSFSDLFCLCYDLNQRLESLPRFSDLTSSGVCNGDHSRRFSFDSDSSDDSESVIEGVRCDPYLRHLIDSEGYTRSFFIHLPFPYFHRLYATSEFANWFGNIMDLTHLPQGLQREDNFTLRCLRALVSELDNEDTTSQADGLTSVHLRLLDGLSERTTAEIIELMNPKNRATFIPRSFVSNLFADMNKAQQIKFMDGVIASRSNELPHALYDFLQPLSSSEITGLLDRKNLLIHSLVARGFLLIPHKDRAALIQQLGGWLKAIEAAQHFPGFYKEKDDFFHEAFALERTYPFEQRYAHYQLVVTAGSNLMLDFLCLALHAYQQGEGAHYSEWQEEIAPYLPADAVAAQGAAAGSGPLRIRLPNGPGVVTTTSPTQTTTRTITSSL